MRTCNVQHAERRETLVGIDDTEQQWASTCGRSFPGRYRVRKVCNPWILAVLLLLVLGCTVRPSEETVRDLVVRYFEGKGYRVVMIDIGGIEGGAMGEKVYMSPRGYEAAIRLITLQVVEDVGPPWNYKRGQTLTFRNGTIRFREKQGVASGWEISGIQGITVR